MGVSELRKLKALEEENKQLREFNVTCASANARGWPKATLLYSNLIRIA